MSSQDVETLRGAYAAFARQDVPAVLAVLQPDIEWDDSDELPFGGHYTGHDQVVEFFGRLPQYWQELFIEPDQVIDGGETLVVLGRIRGEGSCGSLDEPFAHVWTMRDGKAATFREFVDTARVNEVLGVPSVAGY